MKCPACGSRKIKRAYIIREHGKITADKHRCQECNYIFDVLQEGKNNKRPVTA